MDRWHLIGCRFLVWLVYVIFAPTATAGTIHTGFVLLTYPYKIPDQILVLEIWCFVVLISLQIGHVIMVWTNGMDRSIFQWKKHFPLLTFLWKISEKPFSIGILGIFPETWNNFHNWIGFHVYRFSTDVHITIVFFCRVLWSRISEFILLQISWNRIRGIGRRSSKCAVMY